MAIDLGEKLAHGPPLAVAISAPQNSTSDTPYVGCEYLIKTTLSIHLYPIEQHHKHFISWLMAPH